MMDIDEDIVHVEEYDSMIKSTATTDVIETICVADVPTKKKKPNSANVYDKELCKDNKLLTDFINKCLLLDQTVGMESIINKVLLPAYVKANAEYKLSDRFSRVLIKALKRLIDDPDRKYTHISDIVATLKFHVSKTPIIKKRANFVTLSKTVSVKSKELNKKRSNEFECNSEVKSKKSKYEVIAIVDDDEDDDVVHVDDKSNESDDCIYEDDKQNAGTDDLVNEETIEIQDSQELNPNERKQTQINAGAININHINHIPNVSEQTSEHEKENLGSSESLNGGNALLVPCKEKIVRLEKPKPKPKLQKKEPKQLTEAEKARRIKVIEAKIRKHNNTIARLDLEEVTDDTANSPYYKCDRLRTEIVKLYKELCTLVGKGPPEPRKIRLQIAEGVPQGPIKRLEKFLNKQTDVDGETPFPDFSDVIRCVERANEKDGLGWSKAKVMKEAQAIFGYCGRALQRRRQQREWKHLQSQFIPEEFEDDPAERDQALSARLEANRRLAKDREAEVFSRFSEMETHPEATASTSLQIEEEQSEHSSSDEEADTKFQSDRNLPAGTVSKEYNNNGNNSDTCDPSIVKEEPEPIKIEYKGDISFVIEISDSESDDEGVIAF